jgi:hypothetical protein
MLASLDSFSCERFCRQQDLAQLIALLMAQRLYVDLVLGLDLDWTTLRTAVLELHRVVVPSGSGATAVPQPEYHNLSVARLTICHGKGTLFPAFATWRLALGSDRVVCSMEDGTATKEDKIFYRTWLSRIEGWSTGERHSSCASVGRRFR